MTLRNRALVAFGVLAVIILTGSVAFMVTEGMTVGDAIYYTFITITTVGYSEPPGGFSPSGRVVSIFLMVAGLGTLVYVATAGLELVLEDLIGGRLAQRVTQRRIKRMSGHVVLCGYGRIGRTAYNNLKNLGRDVVVVEADRDRAEKAEHAGAPAVLGDATRDDILRQAGIERAEVLIAAVGSDSDNVSIVLSARDISPSIRIIARASEPDSEQKLRLAGADRVVSPVNVGAERLVAMAAEADLTDFVDITFEGDLLELRVEEVHVPEASKFVGANLGDSEIRSQSGAIIIAIRHADGLLNLSPEADARITADATLVGIGTRQQLESLHRLLGP